MARRLMGQTGGPVVQKPAWGVYPVATLVPFRLPPVPKPVTIRVGFRRRESDMKCDSQWRVVMKYV